MRTPASTGFRPVPIPTMLDPDPAPSPTAAPLTGLSSMATRALLADLATAHAAAAGPRVDIASVGGVDAARRVAAGEPVDLVFLAADALAMLESAGHLRPGSQVDLVRSEVVGAVPAGAPVPAIGDEAALRAAVLAAPRIGYSTGPSGTALLALFARWGLADTLRDRLLQAPPGVPVGTLVARGEVALGFQQRSELSGTGGLTLIGALPPACAIVTVFSGAVAAASARPDAAAAVLRAFAAPDTAALRRRHGFEPA